MLRRWSSLLVSLLVVAVSPSAGARGLESEVLPAPFAERSLGATPSSLTARASADGRWLVLSLGSARIEGKGWGIVGVVVYDLRTGEEHWRESTLSSGATLPLFTADGKSLAWCEEHLGTAEEVHRTPTVVVRLALETRTAERFPLPTDHTSNSSPSLAAIDPDGSHVAVRESNSSDEKFLCVYELASGEKSVRFERFRTPGYGRSELDVTLTERFLAAHTRPEGKAGGAGYVLRVVDRATGEPIAESAAYVCRSTPRYRVSKDGNTIWNGTGSFTLEEIDTRAKTVTEIDTVREALYSHFLELSISPEDRDLIAWSRERGEWVHHDLDEKVRTLRAVRPYRELIGIDAARRAWLYSTREGLARLDLAGVEKWTPVAKSDSPETAIDWAFLERTGRVLVTATELEREEAGSEETRTIDWRLRFHRLIGD